MLFTTELMVGFDRDSYTVDEKDGSSINLTVTLFKNIEQFNVSVFVSTVDNTAVGKLPSRNCKVPWNIAIY